MYNLTRNKEHLYSSMRFQGDGRTVRVPLTFDLREGDGLAVDFGRGLVNNYKLDDSVTPKVLVFDEPLPKGVTITIRRLTYIEKVPHIFQWLGNAQGGADFSAVNIDENFEQITRASQDAMDAQVLSALNLEELAGVRDDALGARDRAVLAETNAKASEVSANASEAEARRQASNAASSASESNRALSEIRPLHADVVRLAPEVKVNADRADVSAQAAKEAENNAKASENRAANMASASSSSASVASNAANSASASASTANTKASEASRSATDAKGSEDLAKKWAVNPVDLPVQGSEYSAYHWAMKARDLSGVNMGIYATNARVDEVSNRVTTAQSRADSAYNLAQTKQDKLTFVGNGSEVMKTGAFGLGFLLSVPGNDLNNAMRPGFYRWTTDCINVPVDFGSAIVTSWDGGGSESAEQFTLKNGNAWIRGKNNASSSWTSWIKLLTESDRTSSLGTSTTLVASQKLVNDVSIRTTAAQSKADSAYNLANTANGAAANALNVANGKTTEAWVRSQGYITAAQAPKGGATASRFQDRSLIYEGVRRPTDDELHIYTNASNFIEWVEAEVVSGGTKSTVHLSASYSPLSGGTSAMLLPSSSVSITVKDSQSAAQQVKVRVYIRR